jgi:hypothetical protein
VASTRVSVRTSPPFFVTLALAADRTEAWVTDRTGHRSSDMVHRYKRTARTARELGLGWLVPLDVAVGFTKPAPETPPEPTREREPEKPTRTTREPETAAETVTNCLATVSGGASAFGRCTAKRSR